MTLTLGSLSFVLLRLRGSIVWAAEEGGRLVFFGFVGGHPEGLGLGLSGDGEE